MRRSLAAIAGTLLVAVPASARDAPASAREAPASARSSTASAREAISADAFAARIATAHTLTIEAQSAPAPERMKAVRKALGLPVDVVLAAGAVTIASDPFLDRLTGRRGEDFRLAAEHLEVLQDELRRAATAEAPDRERIRAIVDDAYAGVRAEPHLITRLRERAAGLLRSALETLVRATGTTAGKIVAIFVALAIVAAAVLIFVRRTRVVAERSSRSRHADASVRDPRGALAEALARGDMEAAVRAQYQILIVELAGRDAVPDEPSLTAGECRRAVASSLRDAYSVVADATGRYERVVYADTEASRDDLDALARATEAVIAA